MDSLGGRWVEQAASKAVMAAVGGQQTMQQQVDGQQVGVSCSVRCEDASGSVAS